MKLILLLLELGGLLSLSFAFPTGTEQQNDNDGDFGGNNAMDYLKQFGFMGSDNPMLGSLKDEEAYPQAIAEFQSFAGLEATGKLDAETIKLMQTPRCGVKDVMGMNDVARKKRFALEGSKWSNQELTYMVSSFTNDIQNSDVITEIDRAFRVWQSVTNMKFRRVNSWADINIQFVTRKHDDDFPFDGPGGTLAHAFFPQYGGDIHMDDDENWTFNVSRGINFFQVFAHELGHSLGLQHSSVRSALMAPFYKGYQINFKLDQDDISGIQSLYGARNDMFTNNNNNNNNNNNPFRPLVPTVGNSPPTTTTRRPHINSGIPNPCDDGRIDAIIMTEDETVYAFRRNYYMVMDDYGIRPGYPRLISSDWQGLPNDLDAAISFDPYYGYVYEWDQGQYNRKLILQERIYFFKDDLVYLYEGGKSLKYGYPKRISEVFPGLPNNVDSAFVWSGNGRTYFTKGNKYYRYNHGTISVDNGEYFEKPGFVDRYYPRDLSTWRGLPYRVDAVFVWKNKRTYFFNEDTYYRFDDRQFQVDQTRNYPLKTRSFWFACVGAMQDDSSNTMEADVMNDEQFFEVSKTNENNDDISGQGPFLSSISLILTTIIITTVLLN